MVHVSTHRTRYLIRIPDWLALLRLYPQLQCPPPALHSVNALGPGLDASSSVQLGTDPHYQI